MDINQYIQQQAQLLANKILARDPSAEVRVSPSAIDAIHNTMDQPVADIYIQTGGKEFNYNLTLNPMTGKLNTIAIVQQ